MNPQNSREIGERIADAICIFVGYFVATEIALALHWGRILVIPFGWASEAQSQYSALLLLAILSWMTLTAFTNTYRSHRTERLNFLARGLIRTLLTWALITITAVFSLKFEYVSRQFIGYFIGASSVLIFVRRSGNHAVPTKPAPFCSQMADRSGIRRQRGHLRTFRGDFSLPRIRWAISR